MVHSSHPWLHSSHTWLPGRLLNVTMDLDQRLEALAQTKDWDDGKLKFQRPTQHHCPDTRKNARSSYTIGAALFTILVAIAAILYMHWNPILVQCEADHVRPVRFKIDVTDFWTPRISSTVQLALSLKNSNPFRALLLQGCNVAVYEAATGFKLGSATHGLIRIPARRTLSVNLAVKRFCESLPPPEHRRLSELFLRHKAILLTLVATATTRLPLKSSKNNQLTTNSTRRLDLGVSFKDPFYQRTPKEDEDEIKGQAKSEVPVEEVY